MRVTMIVLLTKEQYAAFAHELNDFVVRLKHAQPGEVCYVRREPSGVIDRAIDLETVTLADHEVVVTMTRRRVYGARARLVVRFLQRFADVELSFRIGF